MVRGWAVSGRSRHGGVLLSGGRERLRETVPNLVRESANGLFLRVPSGRPAWQKTQVKVPLPESDGSAVRLSLLYISRRNQFRGIVQLGFRPPSHGKSLIRAMRGRVVTAMEAVQFPCVFAGRGRRRLARLPALPRRPRPARRPTGRLRRPCRPGQRDRRHPARCELAAMPHPLRSRFAEPGPQVGPALGHHPAADRLRTTRHRRREGPDAARPGRSGGQVPQSSHHLDAAQHDVLAFTVFTAFPRESWRQIWSSNPQKRLNKEFR